MSIDRWDIAEGIEDGLVFRPDSGALVEYVDHQSELAASKNREMTLLSSIETANADLAALREELAITQRQATANWKLVESVREELADARLCRSVAEGEWMEALTAAKQRNADHELALMYVRSQITDARLIAYIDKAIKSTESGASE